MHFWEWDFILNDTINNRCHKLILELQPYKEDKEAEFSDCGF